MAKRERVDKFWLTGRQSGAFRVENREKKKRAKSGMDFETFNRCRTRENIREEMARFMIDNKGQFEEGEV